MSLPCYCDFDGVDAPWYFLPANDYEALGTKRRQRCRSCKELIDLGAICLRFARTREARDAVEERIYGENDPEAIALADWYFCERCADLFLSLEELGFCLSIEDDMRQVVKEYASMEWRG